MLSEIRCDKFKQKTIKCHKGLNIVLGDDDGTNSIGKSTLLMIIDFIFGGKDYLIKSIGTINKIGHHRINFCLIFNNTSYYFARETSESETVFKCNEKYENLEKIKLEVYIDFLVKKYKIQNTQITFRNFIGRFSRIYGKENLNEKRPLDIVNKEPPKESINALIKIFNAYDKIMTADKSYKEANEKKLLFNKAIDNSFIGKIMTAKELKNYEQTKRELELQLDNLKKKMKYGITNKEEIQVEEILKLRNELDFIERKKSKYNTRINLIEELTSKEKLIKETDLNQLQHFFPTVNIKNITDIELFHENLSKILQNEIEIEKNKIKNLLSIIELEISTILSKLEEIDKNPAINTKILDKYVQIHNELEKITSEKERTEQKKQYEEQVKELHNQYNKTREEILGQLSLKINEKVATLNDIIYNDTKKSPILSFSSSNYIFESIDDTGTGTNFKNMIIYDLAILELTELPLLIHDSCLLKQIANEAIENIFEQYMKNDKQVFIAFDRASSYTTKTQEIIDDNCVIKLSNNGNELFGKSWNDKNKN